MASDGDGVSKLGRAISAATIKSRIGTSSSTGSVAESVGKSSGSSKGHKVPYFVLDEGETLAEVQSTAESTKSEIIDTVSIFF